MSKKLYEKMNLYLANQEVAYIKLHNLHWYVKGRSFFTLHAKLEELYDQTAGIIDAVAERLLAVGESPVANMKEALALATIKELADKPISSEDTVKGLIADVEYWIKDSKEIVELAEAEELFLHPLHPYTKALLSAVPIPDPGLEKSKKLLVYDPSIHDYSVDKPVWEEIANGHFVYGNQKELEGYRKEYQSQL